MEFRTEMNGKDNSLTPDEEKIKHCGMNKENYSKVCDIFYGASETLYACKMCQNKDISCDVFFQLMFPLEEVKKFKIQTERLPSSSSPIVNLKDCFNHYFKEQEMDMFCSKCNKSVKQLRYSNLHVFPKVLILSLDRGKGNIYKVKIDFPESFTYKELIEYKKVSGQCPNFPQYENVKYSLIGVVTHYGESSSSGHFMAYCKHYENNADVWYCFNDHTVVPMKDFKSQVVNSGKPYILFYQIE